MNEAIRLGLLVFSSRIFLNWQDLHLPQNCLSQKYRTCLLNLNLSDPLPRQILVWLLMVGSLSIFNSADHVWLLPWLRAGIQLCGAGDWSELRRQMRTLPWIDFLHDAPGKAVYGAAVSSRTEI